MNSKMISFIANTIIYNNISTEKNIYNNYRTNLVAVHKMGDRSLESTGIYEISEQALKQHRIFFELRYLLIPLKNINLYTLIIQLELKLNYL